MATEAMVGNDIYVTVNVGTVADPDYQQIAYQRDYTHDSSRDGIDASHKGSDHAVTVPGRESGTISLTLVVLKEGTGDVTHAALRNAYKNRLPVYVREVSTFPGAAVDGTDDGLLSAEGVILTMTKNGPDNDLATWDCEISLNESLD